jgi:hypothetical protein
VSEPKTSIRIGGGAGFSGDRIEPAVELAERGTLDYLIFECLAERTIALAQRARARNPEAGYDPYLVARMNAVLPTCRTRGIRVITNMGAANPVAALAAVKEVARRHGLRGFTIAAVLGDDVLPIVKGRDFVLDETGQTLGELGDAVQSANAYLGAEPIVEALAHDAAVVITGRVADPSLGVAAQMHAFGWATNDWNRLGQGTVVGHLLECAGQLTGGYFADPGYKEVPNLARLGFPIAEVRDDGIATMTKVPGSGGMVTVQTCTEQLLYEVHSPDTYLTPDVTADFSRVTVAEVAPDCVRVKGGTGRARPDAFKVSVGYDAGFIGEGQISYAGPGAVARARLAQAVVRQRLEILRIVPREIRYDLIGLDALSGCMPSARAPEPSEVRLRVIGRTSTLREAMRIGQEVETLLTNGPAGGGGATVRAEPALSIGSIFLPRSTVTPTIRYEVI